jgi:hypothetical protein
MTPTTHFNQRIVFTIGASTGKTSLAIALAHWYSAHGFPVIPLDCDFENPSTGSFQHYLPHIPKVNINTSVGLNPVIDHVSADFCVVLADMSPRCRHAVGAWFAASHDEAARMRITFTAIGAVTPDPASIASILSWAADLQDRVQYLIVENSNIREADFTFWHRTDQAQVFRTRRNPAVISMQFRHGDLELFSRHRGCSIVSMASRSVGFPLKDFLVVHALSCTRQFVAELDKAANLLLPTPPAIAIGSIGASATAL